MISGCVREEGRREEKGRGQGCLNSLDGGISPTESSGREDLRQLYKDKVQRMAEEEGGKGKRIERL
jgi:hypothetical protein